MIERQSKYLLFIIALICLLVGSEKALELYYSNMPVVENGQCLKVTLPNIPHQLEGQVSENSLDKGTCTLEIKGDEKLGGPDILLEEIPFKILRESGAEKVECKVDEKNFI